MNNRHPEIKKGILKLTACAIAVVLVAGLFLRNAFAVLNEKNAMKYRDYAATHTVEDSVLFIGTYLININAMTDELYEKAVQSGSEANQTEMYYKSELAGGAWFNISDAEGLNDIMDSGVAVSEDEVGELYVQYYVDRAGNVTDVMTGSAVSAFDLPNPYDLKKLPEMLDYYASKGCEVKTLEEFRSRSTIQEEPS